MRQSKFQFLNPYLEKVNFVTNQDFESDAKSKYRIPLIYR